MKKLILITFLFFAIITSINAQNQKQINTLSQMTIDNIIQAINSLFSLFLKTITPRLKDLIVQEDTQKLNDLLVQLETTDWQELYKTLKLKPEEYTQEDKALWNKYKNLLNAHDAALESLNKKYPDVDYALFLIEPQHMKHQSKKSSSQAFSSPTIKATDFTSYAAEKKAIDQTFNMQMRQLEKDQTQPFSKINLSKIKIIMETFIKLLNNYSHKISINQIFWLKFFEQLIIKLIPDLQQILIKEFDIHTLSPKSNLGVSNSNINIATIFST